MPSLTPRADGLVKSEPKAIAKRATGGTLGLVGRQALIPQTVDLMAEMCIDLGGKI
jgi:hypothetical protein